MSPTRTAWLKMPRASAARTAQEGWLHRAHAPAEPAGDCAKEEGDETPPRGSGHRLSRCVGSLPRLLFGLIYGLPILLLVLLDLLASIFNRDILRMRYRLGCTLAGLCRLLLIAGDGRSYGSDCCISQYGRIIPGACASQRLFD